jgi:hypothetical protein
MSGPEEAPAPSAAASLFDLRTVIAVLFGVYGLVLTVMGLFFNDPAQLAKSAGIDLNLWTGVGMLIIAVYFVVWVRLKPPLPAVAADAEKGRGGGH